jgi:hypothetical protein
MAAITITTANIKDYLGVSVDTYDTQIAAILAIWDTAIESMIEPSSLADTDLADVLKAGKLLMIAGYVKNNLPATATANTAGYKVSVTMSKLTETTESSSSSGGNIGATGDGLTSEGYRILGPYLKADAFTVESQIKGSTDDYQSEARLTKRDESGQYIQLADSGTFEAW